MEAAEDKSQFGSAKFLAGYLIYKEIFVEPYIIDAGAGDGLTDSNSYYFLKNYPFKGLLIDVSEEIKKALVVYKNNPNVKIEQVGLAGDNYYYRILKSERDWRLNQIERSRKKTKNRTVKLSEIIKKRKINEIGVLSLDIENETTEVLQEIIAKDICPQTIIIEANTKEDKEEQKKTLKNKYNALNTFEVNTVWIRKDMNK